MSNKLNKDRVWWIVEGIYVYNDERKPRFLLCDQTKSEMMPELYPTKEEAQKGMDSFLKNNESLIKDRPIYWKNMRVVPVMLVEVEG